MGGRFEEGKFKEGKLVLRVELGRIDWLFTKARDREPNFEEMSTVGSFPESLDKFAELMPHWFEIETCPSIQRLAFGAILLNPVESRQAGYRQISEYLPNVKLDSEDSSDFLYQINRPRDSNSGIADLRINRLSKWSVATQTWMESRLSPKSASVSRFSGPQIFACRLELDINTMPDFKGELTQKQLPPIFQELVKLGKEIVQKGDIP